MLFTDGHPQGNVYQTNRLYTKKVWQLPGLQLLSTISSGLLLFISPSAPSRRKFWTINEIKAFFFFKQTKVTCSTFNVFFGERERAREIKSTNTLGIV